ncbi:Gfo/Idh/MocA family protein [Malaciobacter sp. WC5094]
MLNVAIIGIGNISLLFDYSKDLETAYSHIKAIFLHKDFTLKYVVDIDDRNLPKVKTFFKDVEFYNDYLQLLDKKDIDILVIATPTNTHFKILSSFKKCNHIKKFLVEKPLFYNLKDYESLDCFFKDKIVVNYIRRFQEPLKNLKDKIENESLKNLQKITLNYVKGLKNNGSHFIDLINYLFDNPKLVESKILDETLGLGEDKSYDIFFKIEYKNRIIPIYFIALNHTKYNIIEMDFYFENQVVNYINSEQTIYYKNIVNSEEYKEYKFVDKNINEKETISKKLIYNVYDDIFLQISKNKQNDASFENELKNLELITNILNSKE